VDKFILPNFHAALIHFPLGLLSIGVAIELFSFLWRRSSFQNAGRWMILLGTLTAVPAVTSGLYALRDVAGHGNDADSWTEFKADSNFTATDWRFVQYHIILNSAATGIALFAVVTWLGASDFWRKILRVPVLLLLILALALMVDGAWHGGEMVYRLGLAVQGQHNVIPAQPAAPKGWQEQIEYFAPEGEVHFLLAGLVFALSAAALGLSIRQAVTTDSVIIQRVPPTYIPAASEGHPSKPISLLQALNDPGDEIPVTPRVPAARFWVLAALLAIGTIASGLWFGDFFRSWPKIIDMDHLRRSLMRIKDPDRAREGLHIVFGVSILVLTLVLALLTRLAPRSRVFLGGLSLLLILVMAAQVWVGVLMAFDGDRGPLAGFKTEAQSTAPPTTTRPSVFPPAATQPIASAELNKTEQN
jgi:uncharacterized membrane protein